MQKKYALCHEVLSRLQQEGILQHLVLVGSWCIYFYQDYFRDVDYHPRIRTRDIDLLVPKPKVLKRNVDVAKLLVDKGFVVTFAPPGFMRLEHPELIVEFLVPEKGRGMDKPVPLPQLGVNAQPLRFLGFLAENTIEVVADALHLTLPHPAAFALHKLLVSRRRKTEAKAHKERDEATHVLRALLAKGESAVLQDLLSKMPARWQRQILQTLRESAQNDVLDALS